MDAGDDVVEELISRILHSKEDVCHSSGSKRKSRKSGSTTNVSNIETTERLAGKSDNRDVETDINDEADSKSADEKLTTVETERARLTRELVSLQTQNDLLVQDFIKEGQKLYAAMLPFIEPTGHDDSTGSSLPMEALKVLASFLNKRQEVVKSHDGKPSTELASQQLLLEAFLSNPNLSRSSLTSYIKCTYRELQEMIGKLPSHGNRARRANQNPQSTVAVDESSESQRAKRPRVS